MLIKRKPKITSHREYKHIIGDNGEDIQTYKSSSSYEKRFGKISKEDKPKEKRNKLAKRVAAGGIGIGTGLGITGLVEYKKHKDYLDDARIVKIVNSHDPYFGGELEPYSASVNRVKELSKKNRKKLKRIIDHRHKYINGWRDDWDEAVSAKHLKNSRGLRNAALAIGIPSMGYLAYKKYKDNKKKSEDNLS